MVVCAKWKFFLVKAVKRLGFSKKRWQKLTGIVGSLGSELFTAVLRNSCYKNVPTCFVQICMSRARNLSKFGLYTTVSWYSYKPFVSWLVNNVVSANLDKPYYSLEAVTIREIIIQKDILERKLGD